MYQPAHFVESDPAALHDLMRRHPLALLVRQGDDGLAADPLPLLLMPGSASQATRLIGHVARANPMWRSAPRGEALAVFTGAQAYVSPSWYPSKQVHGKVVPTWNYATAHAYGALRFIDDAAWVRAQIETMTQAQEAGRPQPWAVGDAPEAYLQQMLGAIVGIELTVTRLEGKFKLSQNRSTEDRQGVLRGLSDGADPGAQALAAAMREHDGP